jgi:metallo-beta-lactamase class B
MRGFAVAVVIMSVLPAFARSSPPATGPNPEIHGPWSAPAEPFRIVGNIHYVGARNIASYLLTTPEGHVLIDTGTKEMEPVVRRNIEKLGFKLRDIKILLSGHAHFDHVQGHAAMKRATGARVMALGDDATALSSGTDRSPLGDEGWEPVPVDRVLKDGDTVTLGGTTLRANWVPGHTPGCTVWTTQARERERNYAVAFFACAGPNKDVKLVGNPKFPHLVEDTLRGFARLRQLKPDIYLLMHPEEQFAGKVERIKAGVNPHPLYDPKGWITMLDELDADFRKRVDQARPSKPGR